MSLETRTRALRASTGFAHKRDIDPVLARLTAPGQEGRVRVGDDCAAIPDGDGFQLFAIEGFLNEFVEREPWFAGYCGVMVNVSDIYAMGGRPTAVVDALWSDGQDSAIPVLEGLMAGARVYGVPIVGGHTNTRAGRAQLSVAIIGRARRLLSSFAARTGQRLVMAIDLRGRYHEPHNYWDASTGAPPERLRGDLDLLPGLAEDELCAAAKDISMGGVIGTLLMMLEASGLGAEIDLDEIPRPDGVPLERWLATFPSYGFVLSVPRNRVAQVARRFRARGLACAAIGDTDASGCVRLKQGAETALLWDFNHEPFIGCGEHALPQLSAQL